MTAELSHEAAAALDDYDAAERMRLPTTETSRLLLRSAGLDPLGWNEIMAGLPGAIERGDAAYMLRPLREVGRRALDGTLEFHGPEVETAVIRDFDVVASAAQRVLGKHSPVVFEAPGLNEAFQIITVGSVTQRPGGTRLVQRGTVTEYLAQDPYGPHPRLFTSGKVEPRFVGELIPTYFATDAALEALAPADFELDSVDDHMARLNNVRAAFDAMRLSQAVVDLGVPLKEFNDTIQVNFPRIMVDWEDYFAPGGSGLPTLALEQMLRGFEVRGQGEYRTHFNNSWPYLTPTQRLLTGQFISRNGQSYANFVNDRNTPLSSADRSSLRQAVIAACSSADRWRGDHYRSTDESFVDRPKGAQGSGGGNPSMLLTVHHELQAITRELRVQQDLELVP